MYRLVPLLTIPVTQTVDELRNEIRQAVGRHERIESTAFTKEALAAICEAVNYCIDRDHIPSKSQMRAGILREIGVLKGDDPDGVERPFRKAELKAIVIRLQHE